MISNIKALSWSIRKANCTLNALTLNQSNTVTLIGPDDFTCRNAATLKPKEIRITKLPITPIIPFEKMLRPTPLMRKPAKGNKGISLMYLSMFKLYVRRYYVYIYNISIQFRLRHSDFRNQITISICSAH